MRPFAVHRTRRPLPHRLAASLLLAALPLGCASTVDLPPTSTGEPPAPDAGPTVDAGPVCAPVTPPDGTGSVTFAITRLYLGDTRRDGTPDPQGAWKGYGFDLDGKWTTSTSTDVCVPKPMTMKEAVLADGDHGIDNAFGASVFPILAALAPGFSQAVNDAIGQGGFTLLLDLDQLGPSADQTPLVARAYRAGALGSTPKLDGTDAWPVRAASLTDPGDTSTAVEAFPMGWVCHDTWMSGVAGSLTLDLVMSGAPLQLHLHHVFVQMDLDPTRDGAANGTIAGILDPDELAHALFTAAVTAEPDLCSDEHAYDAFMSVELQFHGAADILLDGSQDPTKTCSGISIGLGFDAHRAQLGPVDTTPEPAPPCMVP